MIIKVPNKSFQRTTLRYAPKKQGASLRLSAEFNSYTNTCH